MRTCIAVLAKQNNLKTLDKHVTPRIPPFNEKFQIPPLLAKKTHRIKF